MDRFHEHEQLAFMRAGIIASTIANVNRDPEKTPEPFTCEDFMPSPMRTPKREKTKEQLRDEWNAEMRLLNAKLGGIDLTNG